MKTFTLLRRMVLFVALAGSISIVKADPSVTIDTDSTVAPSAADKSISMKYGSKGLEFKSADGKYGLQIGSRLQFSFDTPYPGDPLTIDQFDIETTTLRIKRARLKVGGNAFQPWLKYYFEYEMGASRLLDFRIMIEKYKAFSVKVGQWKIDYSQERSISSGKQQFVERSIVNRTFTIDRQRGVCFYGHLEGSGAANVQYWVSVLTGAGIQALTNDDNNLMYVGKLQWNILNGGVDLSYCDIDISEKPRFSVAFGAATNTSVYTRFSSSGGSKVDDRFPEDEPGQYETTQGLVETAFKYKGFSWAHESHLKKIKDKINGGDAAEMTGTYMQMGYFLHQVLPFVPEPLELAVRYANYTPDTEFDSAVSQEYTVGVNWFFSGHRNKLTADYSYLRIEDPTGLDGDGSRIRLQWDISF